MQTAPQLSRGKQILFTAFLVIGIPSLALLLMEGGSSVALLATDIVTRQGPPPQHRYARYDPHLGWVSRPNTYIRDMYGPGVYLRTTGQAFRNNYDFRREAPPG